MRKAIVLLSLGLALILFGRALAVDPIELTATVESVNLPATVVGRASPVPTLAQYNYDAGLTNIGIDAPRDDCIWEGSDLTIWVKVLNAGYEIVDCAEVVFTLNGEEFARVHVTSLYPGEVRKYSATTVAPAPCGSDTIAAHIDWPLDENPENDHIDDIFNTAGEADTTLQRDSGVLTSAWTWIEGYEYPDYALGSKWCFELGGVIKYIEMAYTNVSGRPGGHSEFFVMEADINGNIIDDGTGGIMNMEFQHEEVYWTNYAFICYPICLPVEPGDVYYFVWCNRQNLLNYWVIDDGEDNPDWNWQKQCGVWSCGSIYGGDWFFRVSLEYGVHTQCENLTPFFCRGKSFYFRLAVFNATGDDISGILDFSAYSTYYCRSWNMLVSIPRARTYSPGVTETFYFMKVPNSYTGRRCSASVGGALAGIDFFHCMNADLYECQPWVGGHDSGWELVDLGSEEVQMECQAHTPIVCHGKHLYFWLTVMNSTAGPVSGVLTLTGYAGYDCMTNNEIVMIPCSKTYPPGWTSEYYALAVPTAARPGEYSVGVDGTLGGWEVSCCMYRIDIVACEPWRTGSNTSWELIQVTGQELGAVLPVASSLSQNYPNPFNAETNISYTLAEPGQVTLKVYDITGRLVVTLIDEDKGAGEHAVTWDASEVSSGVYFYTLSAGSFSEARRMMLLK